MDNKYNQFYYWDNLIRNKGKVTGGNFKGFNPKRNSIFAHCTIVDEKGDSFNSWVCYPDCDALLGFMVYVYLPTAYYYKLLSDRIEGIGLPMCTVEDILEGVESNKLVEDEKLLDDMDNAYNELHKLWDGDRGVDFKEFKESLRKFNKRWLAEKGIFFYFNIFENPMEIRDRAIGAYDNLNGVKFEERLGMDKDTWIEMCNEAHENDFLRKGFVDKLNGSVKDMF